MPKKIEVFTSFNGYDQFIKDVNKFLKLHDGNIEDIQYAVSPYGDRNLWCSVMIVYSEKDKEIPSEEDRYIRCMVR